MQAHAKPFPPALASKSVWPVQRGTHVLNGWIRAISSKYLSYH